jgi:hypothetical protein
MGIAHLDVHAARDATGVVLSGSVLDDAMRPVSGALVSVQLALASHPGVPLSLSATTRQSCGDGGGGAPPNADHAEILLLAADRAARFCIRLALATDRYIARVEARGSGLIDGARLDLPVDLALPAVMLRFDPERSVLSLDDETTLLDVVATTEDGASAIAAAGVDLSLTNEAGTRLGEATTDGSGRARFAVDSARLGPPGRGEFRIAFAGSAQAGASSQTMHIERRTRIDVVAPDATGRSLPIGWPEDGIALRLFARARCKARGCIALPGGVIEARVGDRAVGAAPVDLGEAHLFVAFAAPAADPFESQGTDTAANVPEVPVTLRYISDTPWLQSAGDLILIQPVRRPSPWRKVPLVLAAAIVVGWLVMARYPVRRQKRRATRRPAAKPFGEALELLHPAAPDRGWTGHVADAHAGSAISGARVAVERRGFDRVDVVFETTADMSGAFALPPFDRHPGDILVVESALHAVLRQTLPPAGKLAVALVARKRDLLDRFIAWARRQGSPYDATPDPTPGQVRRAARGSNEGVARWANAVEQAVYGAAGVDEQALAEVDGLAPSDARLRRH